MLQMVMPPCTYGMKRWPNVVQPKLHHACCYIHIVSTFLPLAPGEHRKLVVWSDRCVGQNNNFKMVILLKNLVSWKYFTEADQKFFCSGHSFLPCDREFALIERQKKTSMVYVPFDWVTVIANARPSKPFHVRYTTQKDYKNFDALEKCVGKPKDLKITEAMWIHFTADDPTRVYDVRWYSQHRNAAGYEANSLCRRSCHPHHGEDRVGPHPHDGGHPEQRGELDAGKFPATGVFKDEAVLLIGGRRSGPITFRLGNEIVQPQSELRYLRVSRVGPANDLFQTRFVSGRESGKDCGNAGEADVQLGRTLLCQTTSADNGQYLGPALRSGDMGG
jgi:hypothetical protein